MDRFDVYITDKLGNVVTKSITEVRIHPNFVSASLRNNIALGFVNTPYEVSSSGPITTIALPDRTWPYDYYLGVPLTVCGFRNPYTAQTRFIGEPTCEIFTPRARDYCNNIQRMDLSANEICAESSNVRRTSVCNGDFGAAIYFYNKATNIFTLWGVASFSRCLSGASAYVVVVGTLQDWVVANQRD